MRTLALGIAAAFLALALGACGVGAGDRAEATTGPLPPPMPFGACLNISNALEAPNEGEWGERIQVRDMPMIARTGFEAVRFPVRWDHKTGPAPDYAIEPAFMARVAEVMDAALAAGLWVVLDVHHFDSFYETPAKERAHFIAIWRQIAARFAGYPPQLVFEVLNEPRGPAMTPEAVYQLNIDALGAIRPRHPNRLVVIGGPNWNSITGMGQIRMPQDPNLAVTFHYYEPFELTHHLAVWMNPKPRFDRRWGTPADLDAMAADFAQAESHARRLGAPVFLGEFGVNRMVPVDQRALWVKTARQLADKAGFGWCHFDYTSEFTLYERARGRWIPEMMDALFDGPPRAQDTPPRAAPPPAAPTAAPPAKPAARPSWNTAGN
jgi:endoglucanase